MGDKLKVKNRKNKMINKQMKMLYIVNKRMIETW